MYSYLDELAEELNILDQEELMEMLIELGKELPDLEEDYKLDENKVQGCMSEVWIVTKIVDDEVYLFGDSSSMIVKGYVAILVNALSGLKVSDILKTKEKISAFLDSTNINSNMTASRADAFSNIYNHILECLPDI